MTSLTFDTMPISIGFLAFPFADENDLTFLAKSGKDYKIALLDLTCHIWFFCSTLRAKIKSAFCYLLTGTGILHADMGFARGTLSAKFTWIRSQSHDESLLPSSMPTDLLMERYYQISVMLLHLLVGPKWSNQKLFILCWQTFFTADLMEKIIPLKTKNSFFLFVS